MPYIDATPVKAPGPCRCLSACLTRDCICARVASRTACFVRHAMLVWKLYGFIAQATKARYLYRLRCILCITSEEQSISRAVFDLLRRTLQSLWSMASPVNQ